MAPVLQPNARPAGSAHFLSFSGIVKKDSATIAVYPKENSCYPNGAVALVMAPVRFLLADTTDLTNERKQLPLHVFDDELPAGSSPHAPVAGTGILNAADEDISARTWCQNLYVRVTPRTAAAKAALLCWDPAATKVCLDTPTSGLGTNTGRPVVVLGFTFSGAPQAPAPDDIDLDVEFEVRFSEDR